MNGKWVGIILVASAVIGGAAMYVLQVYAFYREVTLEQVELTLSDGGGRQAIATGPIRAIDASSSPLRFRACFETSLTQDALAARFATHPDPEPLTAPGWFDCYDAQSVGDALARGEAMAFLGQAEILDGVDRVIAVFADGRGYAWHQLNEKYRD